MLQRGDFIRLGKAIAKFNRTIDKLKNEENKNYLPKKLDYAEERNRIFTKRELERQINAMKRLNVKSAELYETDSGEKITKWEMQQLRRNRDITAKRIKKELEDMITPKGGFISFGDGRYEGLITLQEKLSMIEKLKGDDFQALREQLLRIGRTDYKSRRANQFRENYINMLEKAYSNYDNFDKLKKYVEKFKNPYSFYNAISKNEKLSDIQFMYDLSSGVIGISGVSTQEAFNGMLQSLGILKG